MRRYASSGRSRDTPPGTGDAPPRPSIARTPCGLTGVPPFASVAYAPASSSGVTSKLPSARAGTGRIRLVKPTSRAVRTTLSSPAAWASRTAAALDDRSSACRTVISPSNRSSKFRGAHSLLRGLQLDGEVLDERGRRHHRRLPGRAAPEGGQEDERLERGPRLAAGVGRAVERGELVVSAPHQGADRSRRRVESHHGGLEPLAGRASDGGVGARSPAGPARGPRPSRPRAGGPRRASCRSAGSRRAERRARWPRARSRGSTGPATERPGRGAHGGALGEGRRRARPRRSCRARASGAAPRRAAAARAPDAPPASSDWALGSCRPGARSRRGSDAARPCPSRSGPRRPRPGPRPGRAGPGRPC